VISNSFNNMVAGQGAGLDCTITQDSGPTINPNKAVAAKNWESETLAPPSAGTVANSSTFNNGNISWRLMSCRLTGEITQAACTVSPGGCPSAQCDTVERMCRCTANAHCGVGGVCETATGICRRQAADTSAQFSERQVRIDGGSCTTLPFGRCEIDRNVVCQCSSDDPGSCIGPRCDAPQECITNYGYCSRRNNPDGSDFICFNDGECTGDPNGGFGTCSGSGANCKRDIECGEGQTCAGADLCNNLTLPWLETLYGNVFSSRSIIGSAGSQSGTPSNATFCVTAKNQIVNFSSGQCRVDPNIATDIALPKKGASGSYSSVLGNLDIKGLLDGKYSGGSAPLTLLADASNVTFPLNGRVYVSNGDVTINSPMIIANASGTRGSGTLVVRGNLTINANITYAVNPVNSLSSIGSIGWVVIPNAAGVGGNVIIGNNVTQVSGAFFADGTIYTTNPGTQDPDQLTVYGLLIGRQFAFGRTFSSRTEGSERIIYDGRSVANPPPGLGDVTKSLPALVETAAQ